MASGPRCTARGCPVRFASGRDRPCRAHQAEDEADVLDARAWSLSPLRPPEPGGHDGREPEPDGGRA